MSDANKEKIIDAILGDGDKNGDIHSQISKIISGPLSEKYGMDDLSFDEAVDLAQKKFLRFSSIFYKKNADNMYMQSGLQGLSEHDLKYIIYDTYIKNINKKFDPNPNVQTMCTNGEIIYI